MNEEPPQLWCVVIHPPGLLKGTDHLPSQLWSGISIGSCQTTEMAAAGSSPHPQEHRERACVNNRQRPRAWVDATDYDCSHSSVTFADAI